MCVDPFEELIADEVVSLNGGGCALIGAFIAACALTSNWAGVAGGLVSAYNSGCLNNW